jgi:hypothetical protein
MVASMKQQLRDQAAAAALEDKPAAKKAADVEV